VTQDRFKKKNTSAERTLAELLADVLRVDRLSVESHVFDELGADSLVMAKFCARVRKQGDLPSVAMKDIYRHPTIRSLAAAVADAVPPAEANSPTAGALELPPPTPTSAREHVLCGALQALFYLGFSYLGVLAAVEGYQWLVAEAAGVLPTLPSITMGIVAREDLDTTDLAPLIAAFEAVLMSPT